MKLAVWLWIIALLVTGVSARWQRMTGPSHPLSGRATLGGETFRYTLERTHKGPGDQRVALHRLPADVTGAVEWKRFGTRDPWTSVPLRREGGSLVAELPHQPPAGKLWFRVALARGAEKILLPPRRPAAIRFTGVVPLAVLVPHILCMFLAMLLSTRAGLEVFAPRPALRGLTYWTLGILFVGGMVLGPFVTHYAFGPWWTGIPVGTDLTDNKTVLALLGWIIAAIAIARRRAERPRVFLAALVMLGVFAIPHSWTGVEPDYAKLDAAAPAAAPAR